MSDTIKISLKELRTLIREVLEEHCGCPYAHEDEEEMDEVAPPGREEQVKALKKKGVKNPWAVAWSSYNKSHGK